MKVAAFGTILSSKDEYAIFYALSYTSLLSIRLSRIHTLPNTSTTLKPVALSAFPQADRLQKLFETHQAQFTWCVFFLMPYQILCNDVRREDVKASPDLDFGPLCYALFMK